MTIVKGYTNHSILRQKHNILRLSIILIHHDKIENNNDALTVDKKEGFMIIFLTKTNNLD
ncbi:MAG: hypothetical protein H0X03_07565 [Nitrosopumilus sp.]|nr:hypothetical protein [Nitrosopumilus sp.]